MVRGGIVLPIGSVLDVVRLMGNRPWKEFQASLTVSIRMLLQAWNVSI